MGFGEYGCSYLNARGKYCDIPVFLRPGEARYAFEKVRARTIYRGYEAVADSEVRPPDGEEPEIIIPAGVRHLVVLRTPDGAVKGTCQAI